MKATFRIVFFGTPDFAVASLKILIENNYNVVAVVTAPDKPAGRGRKIHESAVKLYAKKQQLTILQPLKLKDPEFLSELLELKADLQVVVAFRMLPEQVWSSPKYGTFNLHASLLPQYRGAAPINWAIINGETETGVTTFMLKQEIDTGEIIDQVSCKIDEDENVGNLHDTLMLIGSELVMKTVDQIITGRVKTTPQDEFPTCLKLNEAPKIFKEDCRIKWNSNTLQVHNFVRGLSPYPTAWSILEDLETGEKKAFKIFQLERKITKHQFPSGSIHSDNKTYLNIAVQDGYVSLKIIQLEGKKRMCIEEFLNGFTITGTMKLV